MSEYGGSQDSDGRVYLGGYDVGEPPEAQFRYGPLRDRGVAEVYAGPDAGWVRPDGPQAPAYPDALRAAPAWTPADAIDDPDGRRYYDDDPAPRNGDPGRLMEWMERHKIDRRALAYEQGAASVEREPATDPLAARRLASVRAITDISADGMKELHRRVTEFRGQWRQDGTSQVRSHNGAT